MNVQVLLRCRPYTTEETKSKQPQVVKCSDHTREVCVWQNASNRQISKTYAFDRVFGPDAGQSAIYQQAITGIVEEVLEGFNCCIFAYGQTGTGKTYTMQGNTEKAQVPDASSSTKENAVYSMPDDAGVIPRAVDHIFQALEAADAEYSIKCTFLELYNEEITDLLSKEDITNPNERKRLQLMEDHKGQVLVRGLEEVTVTNSDEIFKVLDDGTARRRTAETMLNKQSSRSHSVFSITIHIKEATSDGEELIKCGKLNLVDLAGSENISRSGTGQQKENRAREAGEINKSLLTLGRVITALVERGNHVPYRDSKLTRLLRDALGGRSKTCIIATVAPTYQHLEETLSTLDYAHRAKNIRNKPELNQKMTKAAHIKELTHEIERLKNELDAMREEKGVYLPHEKYNAEQQERAKLQQRCEEIEAEMAHYKQQYDDMLNQFNDQSKKLEAESAARQEVETTLQHTRDALEATRAELQHRMHTHAPAHRMEVPSEFCSSTLDQSTQDQQHDLTLQANNLTSSLQQSVSAVQTLYDSMHTMAQQENCKPDAVRSLNNDMACKIGNIETAFLNAVDAHKAYHQRISHNIERLLEELHRASNEHATHASDLVDCTASGVQSASQTAREMEHGAQQCWQAALESCQATKADTLSKVNAMREAGTESIGSALESNSTAKEQLMQMAEQQRDASNELVRCAESIASSARESLQKLGNTAAELNKQAQDGYGKTVSALEQAQSDVHDVQQQSKDALIQKIGALLEEHMNKEYNTLQAGMQGAKDAASESATMMQQQAQALETQAASGSSALAVPVAGVKRQAETSVSALDEGSKKASTLLDSAYGSADEASRRLEHDGPEIGRMVQKLGDDLNAHAAEAHQKHQERSSALQSTLDRVQTDSRSKKEDMEHALGERHRAVDVSLSAVAHANTHAGVVQYTHRDEGNDINVSDQQENAANDAHQDAKLAVDTNVAATATATPKANGGSTPGGTAQGVLAERAPNTDDTHG